MRLLPENRYVVQSVDRVRLPAVESERTSHEMRFWELFIEEAPEARSRSFASLEDAIRSFDEEFGNL